MCVCVCVWVCVCVCVRESARCIAITLINCQSHAAKIVPPHPSRQKAGMSFSAAVA